MLSLRVKRKLGLRTGAELRRNAALYVASA
jgi:hypothetical protein